MNQYFAIILALLLSWTASQTTVCAQNSPMPAHEDKIHLFSLEDVRITDGQFLQIQELDHEYLLTLDPDRLLSWFRREAGLMQKQEPYPYWESEEAHLGWPLAGHILGFYMSSMSMMYQSTGDARILERLTYVLDELKTCQDANGNGYLLPTLKGKELFKQVHDGAFTTNTWAVWNRRSRSWSKWRTGSERISSTFSAISPNRIRRGSLHLVKRFMIWSCETREDEGKTGCEECEI